MHTLNGFDFMFLIVGFGIGVFAKMIFDLPPDPEFETEKSDDDSYLINIITEMREHKND